MLSLAPFRYRNILEKDGGPVRKVNASEGALWDGSSRFFAAASLVPSLRPAGPKRLALYDDDDGGGTHPSKNMACFIAISEALERWAFNETCSSPLASKFGFDVDDSSTGMAAFPGLTAGAARPASRREAIERWAILEWWRGTLAAERHDPSGRGISGLRVTTPFDDTVVLLLWTGTPLMKGTVYGFAAGPDVERCEYRAMVELSRNAAVLDHYDGGKVRDNGERRLTYFASAEGHARFRERVRDSLSRRFGAPRTPRLLVDSPVPGPWSEYAGVWRVLFEYPGGPDTDMEPDVFLF